MFDSPFNHTFAFVILSASEPHDCVLHPEEARLLDANTSLKRKRDFCLGRMAAHLALKQMGFPTPPPVLKGEAGEPLWPDGVAGSITHCGNWAIAVAAQREQAGTIGIDLEQVTSSAGIPPSAVSPVDYSTKMRMLQAEDVADLICLESELDGLTPEQDYSERVTMLFSAKEAIFKAFYPLCRRFIDFKEVRLHWIHQRQLFLGELLTTLTPHFARGYEFEVGCRRKDDWILTYVTPESASRPAQGPAW